MCVYILIIAPAPNEVTITALNITNIVTIGSRLVLTCSVISLANVTFEWYHPNNMKVLNFSLSNNGENYNSTVVIDAITTEDGGIYCCIAENEGGVKNSTINIIVYGKCPQFNKIFVHKKQQ